MFQFIGCKICKYRKASNKNKLISTAGPHFAFQSSCANKTPLKGSGNFYVSHFTKRKKTNTCRGNGTALLRFVIVCQTCP